MQMKLIAVAAVAAAASFGAQADTYSLGSLAVGDVPSIGPTNVVAGTALNDTITFTLAADAALSGYIANDSFVYPSEGTGYAYAALKPFNVMLDGKFFGNYSLVNGGLTVDPVDPTNNYETYYRTFQLNPTKLTAGTHTITLTGTADPYNDAEYYGSLTVSAVPEPETYALLLAGLGALGFLARRRNA
jgi:hypothetical protein